MRDLPVGLGAEQVVGGLRAFGIQVRALRYAAVGYGDYHWIADDEGGRWFVSVSDLAHKPHCGDGAVAALGGLRRAMVAAVALGESLEFVVPPLRSVVGDVVVALDDRYGLSVFPFVDGVGGEFGQELATADRDRVLELLAHLHRSAVPAPEAEVGFPGRPGLADALAGLGLPWVGGPFSEVARQLVAAHAGAVRRAVGEFDRLAGVVRARGLPSVVTHGEPHPGNLIRGERGYLLVDWDTVGLAVPERDLAVVSGDLGRYTEVTGYVPDADALALYRLRWSLGDVAEFVAGFRGPHESSPDTEVAWRGLAETLAGLAG